MRGRKTLEKKLNTKIKAEVSHNNLVNEHINALLPFGFSKTEASQFITMKSSVVSADDFMLYCLTSIYFPKEIQDYFLDEEIQQYSNLKVHTTQLDKIITIPAIQITANQWTGRISLKELMKWRDAQIINYNENAQRTLRHITSKGRDYYQIYLNQDAVNQMVKLFAENKFIPNTLTFNIPEDVEINYDESSFSLSFDLGDQMLDILDGYHRYIALSRLYGMNRDADDRYMEIRIVQFDMIQAQQFIWQEDQKTKMKKVQSDSMNQYKLSNQIAQLVNNNTNCDFYMNITPNGIINKGYFSQMIHMCYCRNVAKSNELTVRKITANKLSEFLNKLANEYPGLLSEPWSKRMIYVVVYASSIDNKDIHWKDIERINAEVNTEENRRYLFNHSGVSPKDLSALAKLFRKER